MSNLGPNAINTTYPGLLQVDGGVNDILKPVTDGLGNPTGLSLSSTGVSITGVVSANAQNIVGGTAGAVLYQAGVGYTGFVVPGTAGQFLQSNGTNAPTWTTFNAGSIGALPLTGGTLIGPLSLSNNTISSVGNPVNAYDAANKSYVDSKASGLNIKESCVVATTVNITLSGTQTIDGVAVTAGQRVLVKNQSAQSQNGIYIVSASTWSRSSDAATWADLIGATVFITSGSTQAASTWTCNATAGGTIGVTAVVFVQFAASQSYTASSGITLTGNNFTLTSPVPQSLGGTGSTSIGAGVVYSDGTSLTPATGAQIASSISTATVVNSTNSTNSTYANNLTGGAVGDLLYQSASGVTSKLNISSAGFILTSTGTGPEWGLVAPYAAKLQYGTAGSIPYQTGSSTTSFLVGGSDGQVLTYNATTNAPYWNNPTGGGRVGNYVAAGYNSQGFAGGAGGVLVGGGYASQPNGMYLTMDGAANWLVHQVSKNYNPSEVIIYSTSGQGYVNVSGTSVSLVNGSNFDSAWISGWNANTTIIYIGDQRYTIASINSTTSLTLTTNAGTQSNVAYNFFYTSGSGTCTVSGTSSGTLTFIDGDPFVNIPGFLNGSFLLNNQVVSTSFNSPSSVNYSGYSGTPPSTASFQWRGNINNQISTLRVQSIQGAQEENVNLMALAAGENSAGSTVDGDGRCFVLCTGVAGSYGKYRPLLIGSGDWSSYNYQYQLGVYPPNSNGYSNGYVELGGVGGKGMLKIFAPYYRTVNNTWFEIVATGTANSNPTLTAASVSSDCSLTLAPKGAGGVQIIQGNLQGYTQIGCSSAGYLYGVSSDANKKNVTGKIDSALTKINSLSGVTYTWKDQELYGFGNKVGLIAQEVKEVIPEIVSESPDGHMSVDYSNLTAVLVEAIKELTARLEALENGK